MSTQSPQWLARPFMGDADIRWMSAFVHTMPDRGLHVIDLPYRLCSPSVPEAGNTCLWADEAGEMIGWAVWQQPWITLDTAMRQDREAALMPVILAWAIARFQQMAVAHGRILDYCIDAREDDDTRIALLEAHGFARAGSHLLHLRQSLNDVPNVSAVPEGFTIRPIADAHDVAAYVALQQAAFGSTNMTVTWKVRTRRLPQYVAALDLLACAPDGTPVGFCLGWLHGQEGQIEPMGIHPDYERLGLGRALLTEALRRLYIHGATTAHIEVYNDNPAARHLYESVGYRVAHRIWKYVREF
jgi:ribosomal protein S18 acetylase RimI-like enzyme